MASNTVRATTTGYDGVARREAGEVFPWPEGVPVGKWVEPVRFGGKGDHDGDGIDGGSKAPVNAEPNPPNSKTLVKIDVPEDWQSMSAADMKALAKQISGDNVPNKAEAERIITDHLAGNPNEVFADAPAPQTVQTGLKDAGAGPAPDWVAPGVDASGNQQPVQADDE